jgi:3-deoxy-D-manno-octulosonic-acid transferase
VSLVGGSLVPIGGHNPIEAAQLGTAIVHGPHVDNARDIFGRFDKDEAALVVSDPESLAGALVTLFADAPSRQAMSDRARSIVEAAQGAVDRTHELVVGRLLGRTGKPGARV